MFRQLHFFGLIMLDQLKEPWILTMTSSVYIRQALGITSHAFFPTQEQSKSGLVRSHDPFSIAPDTSLYAPQQPEACFFFSRLASLRSGFLEAFTFTLKTLVHHFSFCYSQCVGLFLIWFQQFQQPHQLSSLLDACQQFDPSEKTNMFSTTTQYVFHLLSRGMMIGCGDLCKQGFQKIWKSEGHECI